jgi:hypothetical protein
MDRRDPEVPVYRADYIRIPDLLPIFAKFNFFFQGVGCFPISRIRFRVI